MCAPFPYATSLHFAQPQLPNSLQQHSLGLLIFGLWV